MKKIPNHVLKSMEIFNYLIKKNEFKKNKTALVKKELIESAIKNTCGKTPTTISNYFKAFKLLGFIKKTKEENIFKVDIKVLLKDFNLMIEDGIIKTKTINEDKKTISSKKKISSKQALNIFNELVKQELFIDNLNKEKTISCVPEKVIQISILDACGIKYISDNFYFNELLKLGIIKKVKKQDNYRFYVNVFLEVFDLEVDES